MNRPKKIILWLLLWWIIVPLWIWRSAIHPVLKIILTVIIIILLICTIKYNTAEPPRPTPTVELLIAPNRNPTQTPDRGFVILIPTAKPYHVPQNVNSPTPQTCRIKGNVSNSGERYYHCPNFPSYSQTVVNPSEGDRWFCTEAEAISAGFRAPNNGRACVP